MQTLFKNANLIDISSGITSNVDILVRDQKIESIARGLDEKCEIVDLNGNYVLPGFANVFCDSQKAYAQSSGNWIAQDNIKEIFDQKNALAGVVFQNDLSYTSATCLEGISEREEKELSQFSNQVAKDKSLLFLKVGQSLDELGQIDKTYKKPLSQVLEDFGFLDRKPVVVGGNCFEKDELQLFSQYECDFCITPSEDGRMARRPTNLLALKSLDFRVGIGSGYSFEVDFFAFMRQIVLTQRGLFEDVDCISEQEVLKLATINSGDILGCDLTVKEGNFANFIVVRHSESIYNNIFKTLIWEKSKQDVLYTIKNGKIIQKNGEILIGLAKNYGKI